MAENNAKKTGPTTDELLKVIIALAARIAVPPERLREIVSPRGAGKYVDAYNLCDGTRSLSDVAREAGVDKSNLNKSVSRWVDEGVLFKIGDARNSALLHIYRLTSEVDEGKESSLEAALDSERLGAVAEERGRAKRKTGTDIEPSTKGVLKNSVGVDAPADSGNGVQA